MQVVLDKGFIDKLIGLKRADERKAVNTSVRRFSQNPSNPGLSLERLSDVGDRNLWSMRVSWDLRIILYRENRGRARGLVHASPRGRRGSASLAIRGEDVKPPEPVSLDEPPWETPAARRQFFVVEEDAELERLLSAPWAEWRVFLHPLQRQAAYANHRGTVKITGSAGTGKSVVALHRQGISPEPEDVPS
jgi:hypothetical protein